jgi:hypothetical protein
VGPLANVARFAFRPSGVPIVGFLAHAKALGPDGFAATYTHPFLVGLTFADVSASESGGDTFHESIDAMTSAADAPAHIGPNSVVLAILRRRAEETGGITLGRGGNNDCVVADGQISKVHAVFRVEGGKTTVTDPGSHNGVFVDGERILPLTPTPIRSGNRLQFGSRPFLFLTPQRFLQDLARVLPPL